MDDMTPSGEGSLDDCFAPFETKMAAAGLATVVIETFRRQYAQLVAGATGFIPGSEAGPVDAVPDSAALADVYTDAGREALNRAVVIKLNGGLGTSMGLSGPKSLLPVKDGLSFLDIIARQILALRGRTGARLPLVLMNSFSTRGATLAALAAYPALGADVPPDFLQNKVPKIRQADLAPADWPADPEKEWCPPGHGDIYPALVASGMLEALLAAGYEIAFVSNADNLGAVLDEAILGYVAAEGIPFVMEVTDRSPADRKGGHLAQRPDGQLILRESAQCPPDEVAEFQDIDRYRYFNTNNLWVHLPTLARVLRENGGVLDLPMIRNAKPVDPTDPASPPVYQIETAMGSAIAVFAGARAVRVCSDRFRPVKKTSDLLGLWSDAYQLTDDWRVLLHPDRRGQIPLVELDERYYGLIGDMQARFPHGAPSLLACDRLVVRGDVRFGAGVVLEGIAEFANMGEAPLIVEFGDG